VTSIWQQHDIERKIIEVLRAVPVVNSSHHFGRPYMTAYQLAIALHRRYPAVAEALHVDVGGSGIGVHTSLAQYLARELSARIGRGDVRRVEGAFLTNKDVTVLRYVGPNGRDITSSLTGSGFDLSLFRSREIEEES
jgi:hypothetical protein